MTFWLGFMTAVALIAVGVIVLAVCVHRRQERQRQQSVDDIMAKVAAEGYPPVPGPLPPPPPIPNPPKGIH